MNPKTKLNLLLVFMTAVLGPACLFGPLILSWVFPTHFPSTFFDFIAGGIVIAGIAALLYIVAPNFKGNEETFWEGVLKSYPMLAYLMTLVVWFGGAMFSNWTWRSIVFMTAVHWILFTANKRAMNAKPTSVENADIAKETP